MPIVLPENHPAIAHCYPNESWIYDTYPVNKESTWGLKWVSLSGRHYWIRNPNPPEEFKLQLLLLGIK
jgi:hypothetical protein